MEKYDIDLVSLKENNLIGKSLKFGFNKDEGNMIDWTVIGQSNDAILLWSDCILKDIVFSSELHQDDYNLYLNSSIKDYLNTKFLDNFSELELSVIDDLKKDKFYILSEDDLIRYLSVDYRVENLGLRAKPSSLLFSNGFETNESGYGKYWLKNYDSKHDYAKIVDSFGNITRAKINNPNIGIRVAVWIKKADTKKLIEKK